MTTVSDIYRQARSRGEQPVSFEIFPPKGDLTLSAAQEVASKLTCLDPAFISVTYSAGGSGNKHATAEVASLIQADYGVPTVAHLTCAGASDSSLSQSIADLKSRNIQNVLALRGDLTPGCEPTAYRYARDLITRLTDEGFCVGAAAYPEGHITCTDENANIEHLKMKQDAGAQFFITQLFFDNSFYYRFWEQALAQGITVPISCGIMPFLGKAQIQRMVFMCGASLPSPIIKLLARYEDSSEDLRRAGIEYANEQLLDLAAHGVDGLHIYTMNHADIAGAGTAALRAARRP